ncbi:NAD(P)-dependent alcohol dehydrogenase [Nonomuraea sp. NPDC049419]|uniref:NAD(P)-dependent alcohol dehydrogenase n=1 Tax=Nonomuraea sp. NPDC049419 TaxID=3155772 RepID=UPI00343B3418
MTMQAVRYRAYGPPEVVELHEVPAPVPGEGEVLVRVRAAAVNPGDWHFMRGSPYAFRAVAGLTRPKAPELGNDFAGEVEAVGKGVGGFQPGDRVYGCRRGAFAEYVTMASDGPLSAMPGGLAYEEAAAIPTSGLTALQALRDKGGVREGRRVLVNGASGGIGTFAVRLAKAYGAEVTGVCSGGNVELVRSLGADHVIDYTRQDFTTSGRRYDLVLDNVGNHSLRALRRVLEPGGTLIPNSGDGGRWFGPIGRMVVGHLTSRFAGHRFATFMTSENAADLATLRELAESGALTPVIDRTYPLREAAAAIAHLEGRHARGKIVLLI